jgi:hypothetical protein
MGLDGYYKHFIKGFSKITGPSTVLKKKEHFLQMERRMQGKFSKVKAKTHKNTDVDDTQWYVEGSGLKGGICPLSTPKNFIIVFVKKKKKIMPLLVMNNAPYALSL